MIADEFVGIDLSRTDKALDLPPRHTELYVGLGYHILPFQAFDKHGRIVDPVQVPDSWKEAYLGAQGIPEWQEILRALNLLNKADWGCYAVGIDYVREGFRVMPAKRIETVTPSQAQNWLRSYDDIIAKRIIEVGGRRPAIDPRWLGVLRAVIGLFNSGGGAVVDPDDPDRGVPSQATLTATSPAEPAPGNPAAMAVGALAGLVEALLTFPVSKQVSTTTIWYRGASGFGGSRMGYDEAKRWSGLGPVYRAGGFWRWERIMANIIWDAVAPGTLWWWDQPAASEAVEPDPDGPGEDREPKEPVPRPEPVPGPPPWASWGHGVPRQPLQFCRALWQTKACAGSWKGNAQDHQRWVDS